VGKGGYFGGSTVVGARSGWFSFKSPAKKQKASAKATVTDKGFETRQARRDNFFAMLQRTTKLSDSAVRKGNRRQKKRK
jgi:hypothetical protein